MLFLAATKWPAQGPVMSFCVYVCVSASYVNKMPLSPYISANSRELDQLNIPTIISSVVQQPLPDICSDSLYLSPTYSGAPGITLTHPR